MEKSYLNARNNFFSMLSKRLYSVFLRNDILFRFSKYFKLHNEAVSVMRRFTQNIIRREKIRRKEAGPQRSKVHLIDVLLANNFEMHNLCDHVDTFITAVSILRMIIV